MYSNLLFLILVLIIISFSLDASAMAPQTIPFSHPLLVGAAAYLFLLLLIILQNRLAKTYLHPRKKRSFLLLAQIEILAFLIYLHFYLYFAETIAALPLPQFCNSLITLFLYFFALAIAHLSGSSSTLLYFAKKHSHRLSVAWAPIQLLFPFTVPFLLFTFLADLYALLPLGLVHSITGINDEFLEILWVSIGAVLFLLAMMLFLPYVIQRSWGCKDLPESILKIRLEELCKRARFKYSGMKTWPVMQSIMTAAIIGIYSHGRYVMFTDSLLKHLTPDEVEAVLSHEIAHSKYKHLLFYPLLILGMGVLTGLFTLFFGDAIANFFELELLLHPDSDWRFLEPIINLIIYAGLLILYFRIVFGLFSRNFERQADLYHIKLGLPPQSMINALDRIARLSGNMHDVPNWHHYSIRQRMNFIERAANDRKVFNSHQRRVRRLVSFYLIFLCLSMIILLLPLGKHIPLLAPVGNELTEMSKRLDDALNRSRRTRAVQYMLLNNPLPGNQQIIQQSLYDALETYNSYKIPGMVEFYTAQTLLEKGQIDASTSAMIQAWENANFARLGPNSMTTFNDLTSRILKAAKAIDSPYAGQLENIEREKNNPQT